MATPCLAQYPYPKRASALNFSKIFAKEEFHGLKRPYEMEAIIVFQTLCFSVVKGNELNIRSRDKKNGGFGDQRRLDFFLRSATFST